VKPEKAAMFHKRFYQKLHLLGVMIPAAYRQIPLALLSIANRKSRGRLK
jgi:hypothetical protein